MKWGKYNTFQAFFSVFVEEVPRNMFSSKANKISLDFNNFT